MPTRTQSRMWRSFLLGALTGPILFTMCTMVINLPGGNVVVFDGDTLDLPVPTDGVAWIGTEDAPTTLVDTNVP